MAGWLRKESGGDMAASFGATMDVCRLRRFVDVNYETGEIFWRPRSECDFTSNGYGGALGAMKRFNSLYAGKPALNHKSKGYLKGRIDGKELKAHRVVWAHYHGRWPSGVIDHINRDRSDNRLANLRDVTSAQNAMNSGVMTDRPYIYMTARPYFGSRTIDGVVYKIEPQSNVEDAIRAWEGLERSSIPKKFWVYSKAD